MKVLIFCFLLVKVFAFEVNGNLEFGVVSSWNNSEFWPILKESGIEWLRVDLSWTFVEKKRGKYNFEKLDIAFNKSDSLGLKVLGILGYTPNWASGKGKRFVPNKEYLNDWVNYVDAVITRYENKIHVWEIWNEPDHHLFLKTHENSWASELKLTDDEKRFSDYVKLQELAINHIKKKWKNKVKVITSGFALGGRYDEKFISKMSEENQFIGKFTGLNIHSYSTYKSKRLNKRIKEIEKLRPFAYENQLWLTELGVNKSWSKNKSSQGIMDEMLKNILQFFYKKGTHVFWYRVQSKNTVVSLFDEKGIPTEYLKGLKFIISFLRGAKKIEKNNRGFIVTKKNKTKNEIFDVCWGRNCNDFNNEAMNSFGEISGLSTDKKFIKIKVIKSENK